MSMQMAARLRTSLSMSSVSRRFAAYAYLRCVCILEIDPSSSSIYVQSSDALVDRIHELANNAIMEREQQESVGHDGASSGNTL